MEILSPPVAHDATVTEQPGSRSQFGHRLSDAVDILTKEDPALAAVLYDAHARQENRLRLTPEATLTDPSVAASQALAAFCDETMGDRVERLALDRARTLFGAPLARLVTRSPAETMASLADGPVIAVTDDPFIGAEDVLAQAQDADHRTLAVTISPSPRAPDFERWRQIADKLEARLIVDTTGTTRLVAAGLQPSPLPHVDVWVTALGEATLILTSDPVEVPGDHPNGASAACLLALAAGKDYRTVTVEAVANARELAGELRTLGWTLATDGTDTTVVAPFLDGEADATAVQEALAAIGVHVGAHGPLLLIGTLAVTQQGFRAGEMRRLAALLTETRRTLTDPRLIDFARRSGRETVRRLVGEFPVPRRSLAIQRPDEFS